MLRTSDDRGSPILVDRLVLVDEIIGKHLGGAIYKAAGSSIPISEVCAR